MARPLAFVLFLLLIGAFALANWPAFTAPATVSLFFASVEAPIGMVMLVALAIVCLAFTAWAISIQGHALMDARRMTRELQAQRDLADKAEASRFTELRAHLDAALADQRRVIEEQANGLAADIAVLEDRLDRRELLSPVAAPPVRRAPPTPDLPMVPVLPAASDSVRADAR
jgi:uncharacterized integral membrane protein